MLSVQREETKYQDYKRFNSHVLEHPSEPQRTKCQADNVKCFGHQFRHLIAHRTEPGLVEISTRRFVELFVSVPEGAWTGSSTSWLGCGFGRGSRLDHCIQGECRSTQRSTVQLQVVYLSYLATSDSIARVNLCEIVNHKKFHYILLLGFFTGDRTSLSTRSDGRTPTGLQFKL
ncbi:hypothetical protein EJ08DRAFT_140492 [Tothia fuscella]|uniref:Uncharacterized protein n=1 Tax=Tothia fuscella TaxID=1048955 RepID=A0A9P4NU44_9PEZI|nr:hypothetical protein EJ08DRAFT_140492 [Tothia fuscella]